MSAMTYKGYPARVEFDPGDEIFVGRIAGINDVVGFHADNVEELKSAFHEAVDDYTETCKSIGKKPQKSYSGNLIFCIGADTHANAAMAAELAGQSLNECADHVLGRVAKAAIPADNS